MDGIILQGYRSFRELQSIPIKPLTILVGENSSGKSSFLAALRTASNLFRRIDDVDFNEPPFTMGAFEQIASFTGGRGGREKSFKIGHTTDTAEPNKKLEVIATFSQRHTQPTISDIRIAEGDFWAEIHMPHEDSKTRIDMGGPGTKATFSPKDRYSIRRIWDMIFLMMDVPMPELGKISVVEGAWKQSHQRAIGNLFSRARATTRLKSMATAPIRTKPDRNYDPKRESPQPEGDHIPMLLARVFSENPAHWEVLRSSLRRFGHDSGLFQDILIRRLGNYESDPFQIRIKISGPDDNIVDVGYGVSQVLPVIVDTLNADGRILSLLQQPEVHLHPRAQAALGSFIAHHVEPRKREFVIETHSDYFIDRIRLDIRDKRIDLNPKDILILYFDRDGRRTTVHPIGIDAHGNITNAPPSYRQFFLDEDKRLFGVE